MFSFAHIGQTLIYICIYIPPTAILYFIQVFYNIVSNFTYVVNYDTDKGWTNIFKKLKEFSNAVKEPTKATQNFVEKVKDLYNKGILKVRNLDNLANKFIGVDRSVVSTAKSIQKGNAEIGALDKSMKNASGSATAFGTTLKNVAANMGIMLAITVALKLLGAAWDHFDVTVEESQAKVDNITTKLKELNEEYDKLNSRDSDSLTSSEKERLNYLKDRISYEEELLDIEKRKQYQEQMGGGFTDLFDKDSDSYKKWVELVNDFGKNEVMEGFWHGTIDSNIDEYNQALANAKDITDKLEEARKGGHDEDSYYVKQLRDDLESENETITSIEGDLQQRYDDRKELINKYNEYIQKDNEALNATDRYGNPLLSESDREQIQDNIDFYQNWVDIYTKEVEQIGNAIYNTDSNIKSLSEKTGISEEELSKAGFSDADFEELLKLDGTVHFDKNTTIDDLKETLGNAQQTANQNPIVITTVQDALNYTSTDEDGNATSTSLNDEINSYTSQIESLDKILKTIDKGTFGQEQILSLAQDFGIVTNSVSDAKTQINDMKKDLLNNLTESFNLIINNEDTIDEVKNKLISIRDLIISSADADPIASALSDYEDKLSSLQSGYDKLLSAQEEYNTYGAITASTLKDLTDNNLLQYMTVTANGISINTSALEDNEQALKASATAELYNAMCNDIQNLSLNDTSQLSTIAQSAIANLDSAATTAGKNAAVAAKGWWEYGSSIQSIPGVSKLTGDNYQKATAIVNQYKKIAQSINSISVGKTNSSKKSSGSGSKSSGKSASDTAKEEIEAYMEYLEKALEGGRITYSDYVRDVTLKLDDMYHNGRITAKEYFDYVEKRLNQQLKVYESALSAVTDLLEDEAQKWQDKIDALNDENDLLEKQKDDYDSILSAVDQVYQDEIDRLNEQKDLLQDKIDAINDENDALELQRKKQEALIALDKARQQRNVKIYTEGRGYFYDIDQDAYKDAQQNLQDIKNEEVIKKLEDEQDALDDSIELLEKYRDLWNDIADAYKKKTNEALAVALWGENYEKLILQNRTQDIEAFKDKYLEIQSKIDDNKSLIDSYQEKVDYYNKLKEQWSDISSAYEKEQQRMYAAQILGANWEKDVLNGRLDVLSQFRDQYLEIQRQMTQAALDGERARNAAAASGGSSSGGSSGGGGGSTPIQNQQAYHVLHLVGGYSTSGEASSKISSFNGKGVYKYKDGKWYVYKEEDYSNLSFGSKSEADDYIKKHLSPAGRFLVKYYHNGLENGLVDFSKKDSNFDLVKKYGLKKYEVPAILKQGEAVMNQEQIKNLGEALRAIPTAATLYTTPDYTKMLSSLKTNNTPVMVTQSVNITLPNITNNSGYENLTRELNRLKLDAYQFANRRN